MIDSGKIAETAFKTRVSNKRIKIQPAAQADIDRHADYIAADSPQAALRLFDAVAATFQLLAEMPFIGVSCNNYFQSPKAKDLRLWRIKGFPNHQILYRATEHELLIVRIIHSAQDKLTVLDS